MLHSAKFKVVKDTVLFLWEKEHEQRYGISKNNFELPKFKVKLGEVFTVKYMNRRRLHDIVISSDVINPKKRVVNCLDVIVETSSETKEFVVIAYDNYIPSICLHEKDLLLLS